MKLFSSLVLCASTLVVGSTSAHAQSRTQTLYGLDVLPSSSWIRETDCLGEPPDIRCNGAPRDWAANNSNNTAQLHVFLCEPVELRLGERVVDVWVDALARFANDEDGPLELEVGIPQNIDPAAPTLARFRTCIPNSPNGTCRWRFNVGSVQTGVSIFNQIEQMFGAGQFDYRFVHTLDLFVSRRNPQCVPNTSSLQLKGVRMVVQTITDCNGNGIDDIVDGTASDFDMNGLPDACQPNFRDCDDDDVWDFYQMGYEDLNNNNVMDTCEDDFEDCDGNGSWDNFEPFYSDLDGDGVWDECQPDFVDCDDNRMWDIYEPGYTDCDSDMVWDKCQIMANAALDCNSDGVIDSCQFLAAPELDLNNNAQLDECEYAGTPYCFPVTVPNSTGRKSLLVAIGSPSIAADDLDLFCGLLPPGANGYFLVAQTAGIVTNIMDSEGALCIAGGSIGRYSNFLFSAPTSGAVVVSFGVDPTTIAQPTGPVSALAGQTWNFQAWHRDSVQMSATSNFSNAVRVTFGL